MKITEQAKTIGTTARILGIKVGATVFGWTISLVVMVLVLVVGNFVLVGGQHLWHREEYAKLDSIKKQMEERKAFIATKEANLKAKGADISNVEKELDRKKTKLAELKSRMSSLKSSISATETAYPEGIPSELFSDYKSQIAEYNSLVHACNKLVVSYNEQRDDFNKTVDTYNTEHAVYSDNIKLYNGQIAEANTVSTKIGSTIFLVPGIGRRSRVRAH